MLDPATVIASIAEAVPDRECIVWRGSHSTFGETIERVDRLANFLLAHGVGGDLRSTGGQPWESPHDHVATYLVNGPEYIETFVASHRVRAAPFNVNHKYVDRELLYLFGDARPRAIVYHGRFAATLDALRDELLAATLLIQVDDGTGAPLLDGAHDYEQAIAASSPEPPVVTPSGDDLHLLYTGGTTGMPKGVLWRVDDWMNGPLGVIGRDGQPAIEHDEAVAAGVTARGRVAVVPTMMHGSGTWSAIGALCRGRAVVLMDEPARFDADDVITVLERERTSSAMIIGDAFARPLAEAIRRRRPDLSALRTLVNSGAALHPHVRAELEDLLPGIRVSDAVGSSESGAQAVRRPEDESTFTLTRGAVVLTEDRSRVLHPDEVGEGWLALGGRIPRGYLDDPERSAKTFIELDGKRYTVPGDKVRQEAPGRVRFLGRDSTTINTGGEKVFAEEVEQVLRGIPGVADAIVVGRPSERWGNEIVAVIELSDPALTDQHLRAASAGGLANYKVPKTFMRVDKVERLPNGKPNTSWARDVAAASVDA